MDGRLAARDELPPGVHEHAATHAKRYRQLVELPESTCDAGVLAE